MQKKQYIIDNTKVFRNKKYGLLRVFTQNNELWIPVRDIVGNIGLEHLLYTKSNFSLHMKKIPKEHKARKALYTPRGIQPYLCFSEIGIDILIKTKGKNCSDFQSWLLDTVLPIAKTACISDYGYLPTDILPKTKPNPRITEPGYIYVIYDKQRNICKIGKSMMPQTRIQGITNSAAILDFYSFISEKTKNMDAAERCLQDFFENKRVAKTEWFKEDYLVIVQRTKQIVNMVGRV